jgi:hypothetical protein
MGLNMQDLFDKNQTKSFIESIEKHTSNFPSMDELKNKMEDVKRKAKEKLNWILDDNINDINQQ